jgi:hypothetical protein
MYMLEEAKKKNNGERFEPPTAISYFGICKEFALKKFPTNSFWINHDSEKGAKNIGGGWYTKVRIAMTSYGRDRAILEGISLENKATPIGRFGVNNIVLFLLKKGNFDSFTEALQVLVTFLAVGRAGEVGYACWKQSYWNTIENILYIEWNEKKTSKQSAMNFYPDFDTFSLDFYFMFFIYFLLRSHCFRLVFRSA